MDDFLRVAAWAESAAPAGKGEQVLIMTVWAADSGEALFQITAFKVGPYNFGDDRPVKTIIVREPLVIDLLKAVEMVQKQPVQR